MRKIIEDAATGPACSLSQTGRANRGGPWFCACAPGGSTCRRPSVASCRARATRSTPSLTAPPASSLWRSTARAGGSVAQGFDGRRLRPPRALFPRDAQCCASDDCRTPCQHLARLCREAQTLGGFLCASGGAPVSCATGACPLLFGLFAEGRSCQSRQPTAVSFRHQLLARRHGPFQTCCWPSCQHALSRVL